ncbi:DUF397 domain-containing protein [Actinomadura gamaensis]|uniref:DUF397 domain-containing protein n=1 Tax=Actinomadura gamaensis TaxID=1763541 RepID=A0ABV9UC99_9ACTN
MNSTAATWRKSTYSQGGGSDCVEVAAFETECFVRDSKDVDGPVLAVDAASWQHLLGRLRHSVRGDARV